MWWKKRLDLLGLVYFKGRLAPRLDSLNGLEKHGVAVRPLDPDERNQWSAELEHPAWGVARLAAPREPSRLPHFFWEFSSGLTPRERAQLERDADCGLELYLTAREGDVLLDRKRLLHFFAAVLGADGVAAIDMLAQTVWTPARLGDELQHDAPLDIVQVHVLHVVQQDEGVWLHSHGLGEMGFVDFDVLRPAEELTGAQFDVLRAVAFAIVEGSTSGEIMPILGAEAVSLVAAKEFMQHAAPADQALRDTDDHTNDRVVCCDGRALGLFGRLLGKKQTRPSQLLSKGMVEGQHLVSLSTEATNLCAARARQCLPLFEAFRQEFQALDCKALAKIGHASESGETEHLWFEVHAVEAGSLDATLLNEPFGIPALYAGQRSRQPIEQLTDWSILTPAGMVTPRSLHLARVLRELRPEIEAALADDSS